MADGELDPAGTRPRIVVVDDAPEVRALVRARLRVSGLVDVVGEAGNGAEAVAVVAEHRPDLVLLDVSMPVLDGLGALPRILATSPATRVVMFSGFSEQGLADRALSLGASAFLEKSAALDTLAADLVAILADDGASAVRAGGAAEEQGYEDAERQVLREHLERFREVFEDAAIGMATVTLAGQVVRANRSLAAIVGQPVAELVGTSYAAYAGDARREVETALAGMLAGDQETARIEHDIADRRVVATFAPVLDSNRRPLYLFVQVQDVTRQRGAEELLRRSEVRFKLLVDNVEDYAIFMLSREGVVESWNAGAQRINGYSADEIVGRHFRTFYPPELQEAQHPEHELRLAVRDGHYAEEGWRIRKDGTRFWANVLITAVHDDDGELVGFAKVTRDVTERQQMVEERERYAAALAEANARLQQAAEDQAHFLAVTAHELRTPVGVLGGTADMLTGHWDQLDDDERTELLDGMSSSATRLRRLLTDLLTASRLQSSRLELERQVVDLGRVVAECVAGARRSHPGVEVTADAPLGLLVDGDAGRLGQAIDNLVTNAVLHGAPPVRVTARRTDDGVEVEVTDAGPGVPEEMRPRLFDRFATGRSRGGTGLGLYIVRQLARAHGGDAWYRPADGVPGAFVLRVPAAAGDAPGPDADQVSAHVAQSV